MEDLIVQAFERAGYTNVVATKTHGQWTVSLVANGVTLAFPVDTSNLKPTGKPTIVAASRARHTATDDGAAN